MAPPVTPTPDDVIEIEDDDVVEMSDFPNTNPYQNADRVLSVIAGNSRFHWAMHDGEKADFFPFLFWKYVENVRKSIESLPYEKGILTTSFVCLFFRVNVRTVAFQKDKPPTPDDLPRFLPRKAYEYMGGPGFADNPSHQTMIDHLSKKKMPCIHIYMVITNPDARETIPKLFRHLPCRFIELQASDFVKGAYRGVGVDRCATLRAAMALYGAPAMVIDGGTAMTWTCADAEKNLIGGGITVGVGAKFNALHAFTRGGLAQLSPSVVMGRMKKCQEEKKPLATIANNTQDAMIGGVLREVAVNLTTIIRQFVKSTNQHFAEHPPPPPPPTDEETGSDIAPPIYNTNCHVCVTGGDAAIFEDLLSPDHAHVLEEWEECGEDGKPPPLGASINHHKNLAGHAVANVLKEQYIAKEDMTDPIQLIRCDVMGARVCKGEKRGTVYDFMKKAAELKDDLYKIKYDDGKEDFCNTVDLYGKFTKDTIMRLIWISEYLIQCRFICLLLLSRILASICRKGRG